MNNYEKLVGKVAEWHWHEIREADFPFPSYHGVAFKDVPQSYSGKERVYELAHLLLSTIFTERQIEALKQGGEVAVTEPDQTPPSEFTSTGNLKYGGEMANNMIAAKFRKVVTG